MRRAGKLLGMKHHESRPLIVDSPAETELAANLLYQEPDNLHSQGPDLLPGELSLSSPDLPLGLLDDYIPSGTFQRLQRRQ
jgi:hypothetical protein